MKMASIVPQNLLHHIQNNDMHMALAHLIDEPGYEDYTSFYKKGRKEDSYLILDNGVIEGSPMPISVIDAKANYIGADEIVLPDAYKDFPETLELISASMDWLKKCYAQEEWPYKLMVVPQGKSEDEWILCLKDILKICGDKINTIGIPKHLVDTLGQRDARLSVIKKLHDDPEIILGDWEIHLLGCWTTPIEVLTIAKAAEQGLIPMVRSCDSAIPYVYARSNKYFSDSDRPDHMAIDFTYGQCNEDILQQNIQSWNNVGALLPDKILHI